MYKLCSTIATLAVIWVPVQAQNYQRRASIVGGGNSNGGKCTIEVVVDGAAEIQINGDTATMNNLSGGQPQWRRFECTGRMPSNPADFRFQGRDGRGRQELIRDPRNGGAAVVRIEDRDNGAEGYTFDIMWGGRQGGQEYGRPAYDGGQREVGGAPYGGQRGNGEVYRDRQGGRFSAEQAIAVCRDEVRQRASQRFGSDDVDFGALRVDDQPGRRDWIVGNFIMRRGRDRNQTHQFACSVNFDTGRVRSVEIDQNGGNRNYSNGPDRGGVRDAVQTCRGAVEARVRERGFRDVQIERIRIDDGPGRSDWVLGSVRASRGRDWETYSFTCNVDLRDGDVRSVDLTRR